MKRKGKNSMQRTTYSEATKAAALADLNRGMPATKVAKKHKVKYSALYNWAKKGKEAVSAATEHKNGNGKPKPNAVTNPIVVRPTLDSNLDKAVDELDVVVRSHGVRSLKRQDLYMLLALHDATDKG